MQPLAGPVARVAVGWVLRGQIRGALEAAADFGGRLRSRVQQKALWGQEQEGDRDSATPSAEDWWNALLEEVGVSNAAGDGAEDDDNDNDNDSDLCSEEDAEEMGTEPLVETRTRATVQGIVRTTVTQASPSAEPEESVLAVGIGAQVLPGRGGPYGASAPEVLEDGTEGVKVRATEEARDAVGDVAGAEEYAEEVVREGVRRAVMVREDVEEDVVAVDGAQASFMGLVSADVPSTGGIVLDSHSRLYTASCVLGDARCLVDFKCPFVVKDDGEK
ncbi:hypothetical protein L227DRAFT_568091 [Lentinus tigrinus ALCF2SS1-6]|uniref:Uncharacterized protein n=1 Tax=Lentinus tigrinus ALCF2SS1-6 TaxID=1328759 RepID=A0A5C2RS28_9APHY|nr:hypothetical protein L227DRAFT_568091 [Lentinus tigrinus ALCF2SS1-6]